MQCSCPETGLPAASHFEYSPNSWKQLERRYSIPVLVFASPTYWPEEAERRAAFEQLQAQISMHLSEWDVFTGEWHLIDSQEPMKSLEAEKARGGCAVFVPMSGGIQPWMKIAADFFENLLLVNAYLPEILESELGHALLHRNAHPSSTDFFAHRRMAGQSIVWVDRLETFANACRAWNACQRLRSARFLKIGETEPWVINSTKQPSDFAEKIGCTVISLSREELYQATKTCRSEDVDKMAADWITHAGTIEDAGVEDVRKACKVAVAMNDMLESYHADGLSMACFAMIGEIDTTSCLAMSALNDSASSIGACEGDMDAAVTLFLLKALGCDFVWIANPIIHPDGAVDLVHCTAPRQGCGGQFPYRLLRHHESGRGVSPEVTLPGGETATIARIGARMTALSFHVGSTERISRIPACHTQIRVHVASSKAVRDSLLGTHFVLTFGDQSEALSLCAKFLNLRLNPTWA